jgi:hypothetical protein
MGDAQRPDRLLGLPPRPEVVRDLVHGLAKETANIKWSRHALERMTERAITDQMAIEVLRRGSLKGEIVLGDQPDELTVKMVCQVKGHREVGVVVVTVKRLHLRVKTVEWEDVR